MKKRATIVTGLAAGLLAIVAPSTSHADTTAATDACLNGVTTVIAGLPCGPSTPSMADVCATGAAHATNSVDYCPAPKVILVGEYELGTAYVPRLAPQTRLDVAMRRTSLQSMRFRCAGLGGSLSYSAKVRAYVCRGAGH